MEQIRTPRSRGGPVTTLTGTAQQLVKNAALDFEPAGVPQGSWAGDRCLAFDPLVAAELRLDLDGEPKDAIDSININRNLIAHGADVGITYVRIKRYFEEAQTVLETIARKFGLL